MSLPNRYVCTVLEEMRCCHKTGNYAHLLGLVEEAQSMFNRMESSLYDQRNNKRKIKELKKKLKKKGKKK